MTDTPAHADRSTLTVVDIIAVARDLGLTLSASEAEAYREPLVDQLDAFAQLMATPGPVPTHLFPDREPGHPPRPEENPYGAWMWRCAIGGGDGLLAGKTVSFKDHIAVAGIPQAFNSASVEGFIPDVDATVVTRVLAAGGRIIGKNTMHGFQSSFPPPRNPRNITHMTGGSSTGSAAAVAAGEVDISFGGDQTGSARVPAAFCGVLGLKPTFGLVSHHGAGFGAEPTLDHVGIFARTASDVACALAAVAGYDGLDPRQERAIPARLAPFDLADTVTGMRIGVLTEGFDEPIEPEVAASVHRALAVLERAGATIVPVSVPAHRELDTVMVALSAEGSRAVVATTFFGFGARTYYPESTIAVMDTLWREDGDNFPARTKLHHLAGELAHRAYHGALYARAQNLRAQYVRAYDDALAHVDVLAMPTVRTVAPPVSAPPPDPAQRLRADVHRNVVTQASNYNTKPFNYTGHPALAMPCGDVAGLPVSLQLVGRMHADATLLNVAFAFARATEHPAHTVPDV